MNILRKLKQYCVYWNPNGLNEYGSTFGTPVELQCRWEDSVDEMTDEKNDKFASKAIVDLAVPVTALGILWKGRLKNIASGTNPMANPGSSAIRIVNSIPSGDASQTLYTAYL